MNKKEVLNLICRYSVLVVLAIPNLAIFYIIFTPLTIYPVFAILKLISTDSILNGNIIYFKGFYANIISACIAGSAYYLLLILNLSTPMNVYKRIRSICLILSSFLLINIIRIVIFALLFSIGFKYFDLTHELTWYFGSTIFVVLIWIMNIHILKIKSIPIYSDMKKIYKDLKIKK